jgi:hypothetical protein
MDPGIENGVPPRIDNTDGDPSVPSPKPGDMSGSFMSVELFAA